MAAENQAQIRAIVRGLERLTERVMIDLTSEIHSELVKTTPIDIGWARANWVPSVGAPVVKDLEGADRNVAAAAAEQSAGFAQVAGYRLEQGRIFISNNVPYILRLNDGYSRKAPAGFVQAAIRKGISAVVRLARFRR